MSYNKIFQEQSKQQLDSFRDTKRNIMISVREFLSQNDIKLLVLSHAWSGQLAAMEIHQALQKLEGELATLYGRPENYMFIKWSALLALLDDRDPDVPQLPNILVIELDQVSDGMTYLKSLVETVQLCNGKKIVFALSNSVNENFHVFLNLLSGSIIYKMDIHGKIRTRDISRTQNDLINKWFEAVRSGDVERMQNLYEQNIDIINETDNDMNETALHIAAVRGDENMVKKLLALGARHVENGKNLTPLHLAAKNGCHRVITALLDNTGVDKNVGGGKNNYTPLHYAVFTNNVKVISVLAEHGADLNKPSSDGFTPLHSACHKGHIDSVEKLLRYKNEVRINATSKRGKKDTALHSAVREGHLRIVKMLIDNGADIFIEDANHMTPLQLAESEGNQEILHIFQKKRSKRES